MKKILLAFVSIISGHFASQINMREHISGFNATTFTYKYDERWSLFIELQERQIEDYSKIDYYEMKGGIGYNINPKNQLFAGFGKYGTYKIARFSQEEYRFWLQYTYTQNLGKIRFDNRIRLEKRWYYYPLSDTRSNDVRARYRLSATLPLGAKAVGPQTFFLNAYDEVFFAPKDPVFKRNRVFGGVGYQFDKTVSTTLGFLWQREYASTINRNLYYLYFSLNFTVDRLKDQQSHNRSSDFAD